MGDKTGIEWTDATLNPTTGCTKVSQGCKHCYAERDWPRLVHLPNYKGRAFTDVARHPVRLLQPLQWKKPRRIFVNSMSDLFHPDVPDEFIDEVFAVMGLCPQHTFQVLTKRARRQRDYLRSGGRASAVFDIMRTAEIGYYAGGDKLPPQSWPLQNVWIGVSVDDQATAEERIPLLLQTPAAVRWISAEPLLGPIDMEMMRVAHDLGEGQPYLSPLLGYVSDGHGDTCRVDGLDWVVAGGESGPKARPSHPEWFRSLRDQCKAAGVPFLFKQWGEWSPQADTLLNGNIDARLIDKAHTYYGTSAGFCPAEGMFRFGKKAAGRHLDGVLHDDYPEVATRTGGPDAEVTTRRK